MISELTEIEIDSGCRCWCLYLIITNGLVVVVVGLMLQLELGVRALARVTMRGLVARCAVSVRPTAAWRAGLGFVDRRISGQSDAS